MKFDKIDVMFLILI